MHCAKFIEKTITEKNANHTIYFPVKENDIFLKNGESDIYSFIELQDTYDTYQRYIHDMHSAMNDIVPAKKKL